MKKHIVSKNEHGLTLWAFVTMKCGCSKNHAKRLLDTRVVFVDGKRVWMTKHVLHKGQTVEIQEKPPVAQPKTETIPIIWRSGALLVVNKPAGIQSNQSPRSVEALLQKQLDEPQLCAVHRLDRDTTGCMLFALHPDARDALIPQFKTHDIEKVYHAIVMGCVTPEKGSLTQNLDGKIAITHYVVEKSTKTTSFLSICIETGRTHQIRRHFSMIKHPLVGDSTYFRGKTVPQRFRNVPRQLLHASKLGFTDLKTGEKVIVLAPYPADFTTWKKQLFAKRNH